MSSQTDCGCDGESRCSAHSIPINICNLANFILGREAVTGGDFEEAGLAIAGGCKQCGASIACYNAYPAQDGYWRCGDCIGDYGYQSVEKALAAIFPEKCAHTVFCADCKTTYDQTGEKPTICGACGSDFIAVKFLPITTAIRARRELGHAQDSDCGVNHDDNMCRVCHVYHGDPCNDCGARAYHKPTCPRLSVEDNRVFATQTFGGGSVDPRLLIPPGGDTQEVD